METRVKERLLGAVILVALIVALVPEILSGPHGPASGDRSANSESMRTYTVDLEAGGSPAGETGATPPEITLPEQPAETPAEPGEPTELPEFVATPSAPAPATPDPPEPAVSAPVSGSGWAVQLGSFANADNAERLARELRGRGYKAYVSPSESKGPKRMRVRVGPEQDRARAEQLAKRLRRDGHPGTVVEQT